MIMTDKEYREIVEQGAVSIDGNAHFLSFSQCDRGPVQHHTWLYLMGLIETWHMLL